jgi:glycosyltransferase involved in cell wall biosynthesis
MISEFQALRISIITATFNAAALLPRLVESLRSQTDLDFEWVVADGGSTDGTNEIVNSAMAELRDVKLSSQPDFGIYDALNRAIQLSTTDYYLVVGADDWLDSDCIMNFKQSILKGNADIYTAAIAYENGGLLRRPRGGVWLYGMGAVVTGHSVGSVYKKSLHRSNGFYSKKYPIAADCYFVLKSYRSGASIQECNFMAGHFGQSGVSSVDVVGSICELYRVQIALGAGKFVQTIILVLRLIKALVR